MKKILVVGQTPPPIGGQAMMIRYMLDGQYDDIEFHHVRMFFSKDLNERGKYSFYKIVHLFWLIANVWIARFRYHTEALYYPVSSAPKVALMRDVIILGCTRFLFKKVIFHFHAAGVSEELPRYNTFFRLPMYHILSKPDLGITSSEYNPKDAEYLKAKVRKIIPLGIPDENADRKRKTVNVNHPLRVLFVGLMNSTKGEGYLLEACHLLAKKEVPTEIWLAGRFESEEYKEDFFKKADEYGIKKHVTYWGTVSGDMKKQMFMDADVFCFPSFFSSESFGIVLLEAMMYQMPVIASKWRGLQSVVEEGENGYLVDSQNAQQIAECLEKLHYDRSLLKRMGEQGRQKFEEQYRLDKYLCKLEKEFLAL